MKKGWRRGSKKTTKTTGYAGGRKHLQNISTDLKERG